MQRPRSLQAGVGIHGSQYKLDAGIATVYGDVLAVHVCACRRCKEEGAGVELTLLSVTAERDVVLGDSLEVVRVEGCGGKVGVEVPGADAVHGDAVLAPFCSEGAGKIDNAALCSMIRSASYDEVTYQTVHRRDIDDTAETCLDHFLAEFTGADESTVKVDVHLVLELVVGDFLCRAYGSGAGIVHKDVDAAEFFDCGCDCLLDPFSVGDIACERKYFHAEFFGDCLCIFFEKVLPAGKKHKVCTLAGECLGHLETKSGRCAGNYCYAAGKVEIILHKRFTLRIFFRLEIWETILSSSVLEGTRSLTDISYVPPRAFSFTLNERRDALN